MTYGGLGDYIFKFNKIAILNIMVQLKNNIDNGQDLFSAPINYRPKRIIIGYVISDIITSSNSPSLLANFYLYENGNATLHSGRLETTVSGRYLFAGIYITA